MIHLRSTASVITDMTRTVTLTAEIIVQNTGTRRLTDQRHAVFTETAPAVASYAEIGRPRYAPRSLSDPLALHGVGDHRDCAGGSELR